MIRLKHILFFLGAFLLQAKTVNAGQSPDDPVVFALNAKILKNNKARIKRGDPSIMPAYEQLLKDGDKALLFEPVSVMEKTHLPPSGDKHDYMSLAPYYWPDPAKPDGLPYINKDGQVNPEANEYKDKEYMPKLCEFIHTLALAYYFSENRSYAEHAAKLLRVWFLDPATKMNPNLNYGQAAKGHNTGRAAGLIETRHFIKVIDATGMLQGSKYWKDTDQQGMKQWFSDFLHWMQTNRIGLDEMAATNNHGAWYDAQRLSMALFLDSMELARRIVLNAQQRIDKQMDEQGKFPREMTRTMSLHYTVFVMIPFFSIAQMAEKTGIDCWSFISPSGKSLKKGFDELLPYISKEKKWEGQQIKEYDFEEGFPLLAEGKRWGCQKCEQIIKDIAGDKSKRLRINLFID
jgi:hypothetical protein